MRILLLIATVVSNDPRKGSVQDEDQTYDNWDRKQCRCPRWLVHHGERRRRPTSRKQALGRRLGLVLVGCKRPQEDDIHGLQEGLGCHVPAQASEWIYTHGYPPRSR